MWVYKRGALKVSYYRSFLFLIVVPILLIIVVSIGIIRTMVRDAAIQNIRRAQDNVVSTLGSEVEDVSLRLSHFVYVNDNEIIKAASGTNTKDITSRYNYTRMLTKSFNYAMVPVQDILSVLFYMKDGDYTYLKDDVLLSDQEVKSSGWYQEALAHKNMVKIGFYNTGVTFSNRMPNSFVLVAGLAPGIDVDRDDNIEMTALFATSEVANLIKGYDREGTLGVTMIVSGDGDVIYDRQGKSELLPDLSRIGGEGVRHYKIQGKNYVAVVSREPVTGCRIVSIAALATLTREFNRTAMVIVGVTVVLFGLFYVFSSYFLKNIIKPIHNTVEGMKKVEEGNLDVHIEPEGQVELCTMIHSFNHMTGHLKQLIQENKEQQQKKHQAEIRALQSQINPHFLVNSLNSIRFIAQVSKFDNIARMAEALIKILSCSFRSDTGFYTLKEEIDVLDSFIYLMQIRYSNGFEIEYEMENSCMDCLVPRLILQPVVENSIVHGFSELVDDIGKIKVSVKEKDNFLYIHIKDNGKGMTREDIMKLLSGEERERGDNISIGITNVNSRLVLNYGGECELRIESERGVYTETVIRLPVIHKEDGEV